MQLTKNSEPEVHLAGDKRYYKVQLKAWTNFDPSAMDMVDIARAIEHGSGILTAIEVIKAADDLTAVDDLEVRDRFETIRAVERILGNLDDIPRPILQKLHSALAGQPVANPNYVAT